MMYALIIVTALSEFDYRSGGGVSTQVIQGFSTEQACINAANKIKLPPTRDYFTLTQSTTCVAMDV